MGTYQPIIDILREKYKFSLQYHPDRRRKITPSEIVKKVQMLFRDEQINMVPDPFPLGYVVDVLELPGSFTCQKYIAVVSILRIKRVRMPLIVILLTLSLLLNIMCITYIAYVLRIIREKWKFLDILQLMLRMSVKTIRVKRPSENVLFCLFGFMSIILCNTVFSKLLDVTIIDDEISFDTFKAIDESPFKPHIDKLFIHVLNGINPHIQNIKSKITTVDTIDSCINKLIKDRNCICIMTTWRAKFFISKYLDTSRNPVMKLAKPSFYCNKTAYLFEKASPYIEKFGKVIQRIDQSRLWKQWDQVQKYETSSDYNETNAIVENTLYSIYMDFYLLHKHYRL